VTTPPESPLEGTCPRCNQRPIHGSWVDSSVTPPIEYSLCSPCIREVFVERSAAGLADAFRDSGEPLPEGFDSKGFVQSFLDEATELYGDGGSGPGAPAK